MTKRRRREQQLTASTRRHPLTRLHRALLARGWTWAWPPGEFPPPGRQPRDEWVRYVPGDCAWVYPGSIDGDVEAHPQIETLAARASIVYCREDGLHSGISVFGAYADCCADHEAPSRRGAHYPPSRAGVQALLCALDAVERHGIDLADIGTCLAANSTDPYTTRSIQNPHRSPGESTSCTLPDLLRPHLLGMPLGEWHTLVEAIAEERGRRTIRDHRGGSRRARLTAADKALALVLHHRFSTPHTVLGELFGVSRMTVSRGIVEAETAVLIPRTALEPAGITLASVTAIREFAATTLASR